MFKKLLASLVSSTCLFVGSALALPFADSPSGFASFLNQLKWDDGKKRIFSNLSGCELINFNTSYEQYKCKFGYVAIKDPIRGSLFCEIQQNKYGYAASYIKGMGFSHGPLGPCRKN